MKIGTVRWLYLTMGILSMFVSGIIYAWSILKAPLGEVFGWDASQLTMNYTITMCLFCLGGIASGLLSKKWKSKVILILAAVLACVGFGLVSILTGELLALYLSYGVMCGFGIGMAYNAVISTVNAWFPDKKGLCSGALMMGLGVSSLLLGHLASQMIEAPNIGWRTTYLILGFVTGGVLLATAFVIRLPSEAERVQLDALCEKETSGEKIAVPDYTPSALLKRLSFWKFFLFLVSMAATGSTVISLAKDLALSAGATAAFATTLVGVLSVSNGLGRILCGWAFDSYGRKPVMLATSVVTIGASLCLLLSTTMQSVLLVVIGLCATGLSYGSVPTISSAFVGAFYGSKHFPTNFSLANTMLIPASCLATCSTALISQTESYVPAFVLLMAVAFIGLVVHMTIREP